MVLFLIALTLIAVFALAWNLLVAGGWAAALALLTGLAAFGAEPTDPLRAVTMSAGTFIALSLLRQA